MNRIIGFLKDWGIAVLLWLGCAYELFALWPEIQRALHALV
jgi:hypothetical protein